MNKTNTKAPTLIGVTLTELNRVYDEDKMITLYGQIMSTINTFKLHNKLMNNSKTMVKKDIMNYK
jgi:hypothetical protein